MYVCMCVCLYMYVLIVHEMHIRRFWEREAEGHSMHVHMRACVYMYAVYTSMHVCVCVHVYAVYIKHLECTSLVFGHARQREMHACIYACACVYMDVLHTMCVCICISIKKEPGRHIRRFWAREGAGGSTLLSGLA